MWLKAFKESKSDSFLFFETTLVMPNEPFFGHLWLQNFFCKVLFHCIVFPDRFSDGTGGSFVTSHLLEVNFFFSWYVAIIMYCRRETSLETTNEKINTFYFASGSWPINAFFQIFFFIHTYLSQKLIGVGEEHFWTVLPQKF